MRRVKRFGEEFIVREGSEAHSVWEGAIGNCPSTLITFAETDGADGLMWESWEDCLIECAIHREGLSRTRLRGAIERQG